MPVTQQPSMAEGILLERPPRGAAVLAAIRRSHGAIIAVDDEDAWHELDRCARRGTAMEPTSAVALAGLRQLREKGRLGANDRVVVAITGAGLKATESLSARLDG